MHFWPILLFCLHPLPVYLSFSCLLYFLCHVLGFHASSPYHRWCLVIGEPWFSSHQKPVGNWGTGGGSGQSASPRHAMGRGQRQLRWVCMCVFVGGKESKGKLEADTYTHTLTHGLHRYCWWDRKTESSILFQQLSAKPAHCRPIGLAKLKVELSSLVVCGPAEGVATHSTPLLELTVTGDASLAPWKTRYSAEGPG